jgi:predicted Fe-S protein YdhL (DUF1289 family)
MIESPCKGLCKLDKNRVCIGCHRTDQEIQEWYFADDKQKQSILESVEKRKKHNN